MKQPSRLLVLGATIVSGLVVAAVCAPLIAPFGARDIDPIFLQRKIDFARAEQNLFGFLS